MFSLNLEDFVGFWARPCTYCKIPIETIGIDRVHNELGYIVGNVTSCCSICNSMKGKLDANEFIERCRAISAATV